MSIDVERNGPVTLLTMNRPERKNAFDKEHYEALADALRASADDDSVHVVILTGAGTAFSSGQDLKEMSALATDAASAHEPSSTSRSRPGSGFPVLLDALQSFPKPLIAAVNGVAVGIGMTLLPLCDLVLVSRDARLRVPFSELGVPPEAASSVLFADAIGWQNAAELLLTSRWISADEAVDMGLCWRVCEPEVLMERARELADVIAGRSPYSTRTIKELMAAGRIERVHSARRREEDEFAQLFRSGGFAP